MTTTETTQTNEELISQLTTHEHRAIRETPTTLYHVGKLSGDRDIPYFSQEGKELSVSPCPETWRKITDLDGKTYKLQNQNAVFYHINPTTSVTNTELRVCCENNFIKLEQGTVVSKYDIEYDTTRYWKHYSLEDAITQAENMELDIENAIHETYLPKLSMNGVRYCEQAFTQSPDNLSPIQIETLIPIWSISSLADNTAIDGVFWNHPNKPRKHTAKRGLIFQSQLTNWTVTLSK